MARVLRMHDDANARVKEHGAWMWRTFFAALFWGFVSIHLSGTWSLVTMLLAIAIGLKWCHHFYEYRCARIESQLWPDV